MGKCLLVSGSLEVCNDNFLHFCVYSCYRNCYAKLSCDEGRVKKKLYCMIQFVNKENLSWSSHCLSFYQFFSIQKKFC